MPPGLSHRDHDDDQGSHHRRFYSGDERRDHERAQVHTGQLERRWGW